MKTSHLPSLLKMVSVVVLVYVLIFLMNHPELYLYMHL